MKRKFDLCIFLCIAFFISTTCHLVAYFILKDSHNLINLIISGFAAIFFAVLKLLTLTDLIYVVTIDDTYYKFGDNVFEKCTFIESKNITDKFLLELSKNTLYERFLFKNDCAEFCFDLITSKNDKKIIVYDRNKIKLSKKAKENEIDIFLEDNKKNLNYVNQKIGIIPITNLPDGVSVTYSQNKRFAVVTRLTLDKYLLSCYTLTTKNTFVKPQDITFDLLYWTHDYRDKEESFSSKEQATDRTNELINEYNEVND